MSGSISTRAFLVSYPQLSRIVFPFFLDGDFVAGDELFEVAGDFFNFASEGVVGQEGNNGDGESGGGW